MRTLYVRRLLSIIAVLALPVAVAPVHGSTCTDDISLTSPWSDHVIRDCSCTLQSASYDSGTGTFTITSNGYTIYGTEDEFSFVNRQYTGNFDLIARLVTLGPVGTRQASAGLMARENLNAGSRHVFVEYINAGGGPPDPPTNALARVESRSWNDEKTLISPFIPTTYASLPTCDCSAGGCSAWRSISGSSGSGTRSPVTRRRTE